MIGPILEELDQEIAAQVKIIKIDVDENPETAAQFGVMSIPTLIMFKDGKEVDKAVGFKPKEELKKFALAHA